MRHNTERAQKYLREILSDGRWHDTALVSNSLYLNGIKKKELREARKALGVETRNNGNGTWFWRKGGDTR